METDEISLILRGPYSEAKAHLAETLKEILLNLGYQVQSDPDHGFCTPLAQRILPSTATSCIPPISIYEVESCA